jgi:2-polyprenyl-3-methyl-5-hydroxy-6-metoxy-1,4-benzoquinol methylase
MKNSVTTFYDELADHYHLLFADWDKSIERQAEILKGLFEKTGIPHDAVILDCACGIGTQALGLARIGYNVAGSDISGEAIARARHEAEKRDLQVPFAIADFSHLGTSFDQYFDCIIAMDNALPHVTDASGLKKALAAIYGQLAIGGTFFASIRDYDSILRNKPISSTPSVMNTPKGRRIAFQVWDWHEELYDFTQYIVHDEGGILDTVRTCSIYWAISRAKLGELLSSVGFAEVRWLMPEESGYYQPIVIGKKDQGKE